MPAPLKFNFSQIAELNEDLKQSPRAVGIIVQRVLSLNLRKIRSEQAPLIPRGLTGGTRRSLGVSVRRSRVNNAILATYGFMRSKSVTARSAIAANVLQKPGARAGKSTYLWIPTAANKNITPSDFYHAENTFIRNGGAFVRQGEQVVKLFSLKKQVQLSRPPVPVDQRVEAELPAIVEDIQASIAQTILARGAALRALNNG